MRSTSRSTYSLLAAGVLILAVGCGDDGLSPIEDGGLQPARLEFHDEPVRVEVPTRAAAGETAVIAIETYGGGCIEQGPTRLETSAGLVEIRPLDRFPEPILDPVCTADLRLNDHSVELTFESPGTTRVLVHGTRKGANTRELLTVERTIEVTEE